MRRAADGAEWYSKLITPILSDGIFRQDEQDLQDGGSQLYPVDPVHPVHYHSNMGIGFYFSFNIFSSGHGEYPPPPLFPPVHMIEGGGGSVQAVRCAER